MAKHIKVYLIAPRKGRKGDRQGKTPFYYAAWKEWDSLKGRWVQKKQSTKETSKNGAERFRYAKERELNDERPEEERTQQSQPEEISWAVAVSKYDDFLQTRKRSNGHLSKLYRATEAFSIVIHPKLLTDVTTDAVDTFRHQVSDRGAPLLNRKTNVLKWHPVTDSTINGFQRSLRGLCRWHHKRKNLPELPVFDFLDEPGSKARPLEPHEVKQVFNAIPQEVPTDRVASWDFYIRGLLHTGLRASEAYRLTWDDRSGIWIDQTTEFPQFVFNGELQKNKKFQRVPITPQFAEMINRIPKADQTGFVFNPRSRSLHVRATEKTIRTTLKSISEKAGVVTGGTTDKLHYASAHDFRRTFGTHWSKLVMPVQLQELMRHESIETTLRYYIGVNADASAALLYKVAGADVHL